MLKDYPLLAKFVDDKSGIFCIPGPIFHDSLKVREEAIALLSSVCLNPAMNWVLELGDLSEYASEEGWEEIYNFIDNRGLLADPDNCVAPDWGGHSLSKKYVFLREAESFG